jgi:hypothetical protein
VIEENVVINSIDAGIQVTADAVVRNNLVIGKSTAFVSKPYTTNPVNMVVANNTFLGSATAVKLTNWNTTDLAFANNAVHSPTGQFYSSSRTGRAVAVGNVNVSNLATTFVNLKLDGTALNARPVAGSVVIAKASSNYIPAGDLNGATRVTQLDAGAVDYAGDLTVSLLGLAKPKLSSAAPMMSGSAGLPASSSTTGDSNPQTFRSGNPVASQLVGSPTIQPQRSSNQTLSSSVNRNPAATTIGKTDLLRSELLLEIVDAMHSTI